MQEFVIFTNEELDRLKEGHPVTLNSKSGDPSTIFYSEEGWKEHLKFWREEE